MPVLPFVSASPRPGHTHEHHGYARDRFVKYEDFNQKDDGIRAGISDENYRDADSEELMITRRRGVDDPWKWAGYDILCPFV